MKEKLYNYINGLMKINLLLVIFLAFGTKALIVGTDFASAAILLVLGAVYISGRYLKLKEPDKRTNQFKSDLDLINADIKELKGALSKSNVGKITEKQRYF